MTIELELKPTEEFLKKINPKFTKFLEGKYYKVFTTLLGYISPVKIIIPG